MPPKDRLNYFLGLLLLWRKKRDFSKWCVLVSNGLASLTNRVWRFYLGFLQHVLLQYFWSYGFNYTLFIFRCAFHLHFSTWRAELVWFRIRLGEIWQPLQIVQNTGKQEARKTYKICCNFIAKWSLRPGSFSGCSLAVFCRKIRRGKNTKNRVLR